MIVPAKVARQIDGTPTEPNGSWYLLWLNTKTLLADLAIASMDCLPAQLLIETSYIIDPSGIRRSIEVFMEKSLAHETANNKYRVSIGLADGKRIFEPGIYVIHLELLEDQKKIHVYHGRWELKRVWGTPL